METIADSLCESSEYSSDIGAKEYDDKADHCIADMRPTVEADLDLH